MRRFRRQPAGRTGTRGFTLIEMLVALVIGSVVMTAGVTFFTSQLASVRGARARRSAQLTARTAMNFVVRQLQHVGRDPQGALFANAGNTALPPAISSAGSDFVHYRTNLSDLTTDNDTTDDWEDVTIEYDDGVLWVTNGTDEPVALTDGTATACHIPDGGLVLRYFTGVGTEVTDLSTATARASVRRINVSLTVTGGPEQAVVANPPTVTLVQDVFLRNVS